LAKATVHQNGHKALKHSQIRKLPVSNAVEQLTTADQWIKDELAESDDETNASSCDASKTSKRALFESASPAVQSKKIKPQA
jgi:hypothetical protein